MDDEHLHFICVLAERIGAAPSLPPLSLSFAAPLPAPRDARALPRLAKLGDLAQGAHYAALLALFGEPPPAPPDRRRLFAHLLSALHALGCRPAAPCEPARLADGARQDHANLCAAVEALVCARALRRELLADDLRRLPRAPAAPERLDDAIALWLSRFPCMPDLYEIAGDLQGEVAKWAHVAAALSKVYPSTVSKFSVQRERDLTEEAIQCNRRLSCSILNELKAYIPLRFPVCEPLFHFFIAELYWATRPEARRYAPFEPLPLIAQSRRPVSVQVPRIADARKSQLAKSLPHARQRRDLLLPLVFDPKGETDGLLSIYKFMARGERRGRFVDVADPSVLIEAIVSLLGRAESEHTFLNLQRALRPSPQTDAHLANAAVFLAALAGSNNEFAATRRVVFFARKMAGASAPAEEARPRTCDPRGFGRVRPIAAALASVCTQTASMTQNLVVIREPAMRQAKARRSPLVARGEISVQTEHISRAAVATASTTISYPYGAKFGDSPEGLM
jgi:hypothetical protein